MSEATVDVADLRRPGPGTGEPADEAPLREDIRLLGRVLGEVIEEQAGRDVFELVESTRIEAFRVRRSEVDRADQSVSSSSRSRWRSRSRTWRWTSQIVRRRTSVG